MGACSSKRNLPVSSKYKKKLEHVKKTHIKIHRIIFRHRSGMKFSYICFEIVLSAGMMDFLTEKSSE